MLKNKKKYTPRHRSRIYTVCSLYHYEANPIDVDEILSYVTEIYPDKPKVYHFTRELFCEALRHLEEYDELIQNSLQNWNLDRLSIIDKNILRMALTEFFKFQLIPTEVTINESVEIGHFLGSKDSPKFINAILDNIANKYNLLRKNYETSGNK